MKRNLQNSIPLVGMLLCTPAYTADLSGFVGLGAAVSPVYSGSNQYAVGPIFKAGANVRSQEWGLFGVSTDGLIWDLAPDSDFSVNLLLTQDAGRKEEFSYPFSGKKNRALKGMGNLPDTVMAGAELRYQKEDWAAWIRMLNATQKRNYGGEELGTTMVVSSGVEKEIWRGRSTSLSVGGDVSWANRSYQQSHYGVTALQAERTAFDTYSPSANFQKGGLYTELVWHLTDSLAAGFNSRAEYLFDESGKSPLVNDRLQYTLSSIVQYAF